MTRGPWFGPRYTRRHLLQLGGAAALLTVAGSACSGGDDGGDGPAGGGAEKGPEAPSLAERVAAGELPPVAERLPVTPLVVEPVGSIGQYGGDWKTALLGPGDVAWLARTAGYELLMHWSIDFTEPVLNIAESVTQEDGGRAYTIGLREGMKWSDGAPFTADDIVFAYTDVIANDQLLGVPRWLTTVSGQPAAIERVDDLTVRFTFAEPQGLFLQSLCMPDEGGLLTSYPRHYLEQFHATYNSDVATVAAAEGAADWVALFTSKVGFSILLDAGFWQNPELPRLNAWTVTTPLGESEQVVLERNPYYFKTDPDGSQLPYLDRVVYTVVSDEELMLLQATNGELDMHMRHINSLSNKPVLANSREDGDYDFFDIVDGKMNQAVMALNLVHQDPVLREVFQNKDFRIGLSHAIDRQELIDAVFQQQGQPWQVAPREESDFYDEEFAQQYTEYDVGLANEHLDRAGYTERDGDGFRLRPDGARIAFALDVATPSLFPFHPDVTELVAGYWREVGVDARMNPMDRSLFIERREANLHDASVWVGDGGLLDGLLDPRYYFPSHTGSNWGVPWANWYNNAGDPKEQPPPRIAEQMTLYDQLRATPEDEARKEIFRQILAISKEEFWLIGTVLPMGGYGIVKNSFRNVYEPMPVSAVYPEPGPSRPEQYFHAS